MIIAQHETKETLLAKSVKDCNDVPFWVETDITEILFQELLLETNIGEYRMLDNAIRQYARGYATKNELMHSTTDYFSLALLRLMRKRNDMEIDVFFSLELGFKLALFVNERLNHNL